MYAKHPDQWASDSRLCRRFAETRYGWETNISKTEAFLRCGWVPGTVYLSLHCPFVRFLFLIPYAHREFWISHKISRIVIPGQACNDKKGRYSKLLHGVER